MNSFETLDETVTENLARPFAVTGRRGYLIGHMNGAFPDLGHHLPGEMAGLWIPPIKLADGFWFGLTPSEAFEADSDNNPACEWLYGPNCGSFTMQPGRAQREFELTISGAKVTARQELFMPEHEPGLLISLNLSNQSESDLALTLSWLVRFDLQGAWWSNWPDRADTAQYEPSNSAILANDTGNSQWCAGMQSERIADSYRIGPEVWAAEKTASLQGSSQEAQGLLRNPTELQGQGISGRLDYRLTLGAGQTLTLNFTIAGGPEGAEFTRQKLTELLSRRQELWAEKTQVLERVLEHTPAIATPDPAFNRAFVPSSLCMDLLTIDLPGLGRGIVAGLPDFGWFFGCDTYYSASGLLISGQAETALATLRMLAKLATQQGGRIPHEITASGDFFNPGNPVETGEFVTAVERAFRWTGDWNFLTEVYEVCCTGIFDYLLGECDPEGSLLPNGPGLLELRSAEHGKKLDVACSLFQGLHSLAYLASVVGDGPTAERSLALADEVRTRINRYFWVEARQEYVWRIEPDLTVHPDEPAHSYVALEMGLLRQDDAAEAKRIERLFELVEGPGHTGPKGIIHPGTTDFVMPIQNAIVALAEFRYGRPNKGHRYLEHMVDLYGYYMPWAIPEFVGPTGCFLQAWSSAAYNWLVVQGMFGLQPDPVQKTVLVQPQLPDGWDFIEVRNLTIWQGRYDLRLEREGDTVKFSSKEHLASPDNLRFEVINKPELPTSFV